MISAERSGEGPARTPEAVRVLPERLVELRKRQLVGHGGQVCQGVQALGRHADRSRYVAVERVGIEHDAGAPPGERRRQVRGDERGADPAAGAVHRNDHGPPVVGHRSDGAGGNREDELVAIAGPQEVAGGADPDRGAQRGDRLACVERQDGGAPNAGGVDQRRLSDDDIGRELPDGLDQLTVVGGGGHDTGASGPIEEVHDLLGHIGGLQGEHHRRHVVHGRSLPFLHPRDGRGKAPEPEN